MTCRVASTISKIHKAKNCSRPAVQGKVASTLHKSKKKPAHPPCSLQNIFPQFDGQHITVQVTFLLPDLKADSLAQCTLGPHADYQVGYQYTVEAKTYTTTT
jgi:hypothetical protein